MPKVSVTTAKGLVQETGSAPTSSSPGIAIGAQSVTAAGSDAADGGAINATSGGLVLVSGADDSKGVTLPALSSVPVGTTYFILNLAAAKTLEVHPTAGDFIHPLTNDDGITVAAKGMLICVADIAGDQWVSAEPAATVP